MRNLPTCLRNLVTDERGNVLMTFGLCSMVAIAAVGGSVDFGRANQTKSKMQNVLDAALVSGVAKYRETSDWAQAKATAESIFKSTFTDAIAPTATNPNPTAAVDQAKVTITQSGNTLTGSATMTVTTPFINMVTGRNLSTLVAGSSIPASGKNVEVAVMVDLTGSMGWSAASGSTSLPCNTVAFPTSKLDYLKCAGEDLLNILLPASGANNSAVRIGIAPFADYVNAGPYASAVTGLAETGGAYSTLQNLKSTKQGTFTGSYSGSSSTGSQFGAMGASATPGSTTTTAGATFSSGHCSVTTVPAVASVMGTLNATLKANDWDSYWGVYVQVTNAKPTSVLEASSVSIQNTNGRKADLLKKLKRDDGSWDWEDENGSHTSGFYVPIVMNPGSLVAQTKARDGVMRPVGVKISRDGGWGNSPPTGISQNVNGYWRADSWNGSDWNYTWVAAPNGNNSDGKDFYVPLYPGLESGYVEGTPASTKPECVSSPVAQPSSKLISCVTERKNGSNIDYTADAIAAGRYVGPYNHGVTSKSNYSEDGKCYVSGRELPAVIPLTNSRSTLEAFFQNATAGGATPGHLGTAWASYLLSPQWADIWPSESAPTAYTSTNIKKFAVLMTDGEYNLQFTTGSTAATSAKQALMLCKQMRDNGISVFTVGFGFEDNAAPPTANIEGMTTDQRTTPLTGAYTSKQKALDTLAKCASSNSSYYFPYDGQALRDTFKSIATAISANVASGSGRLTD